MRNKYFITCFFFVFFLLSFCFNGFPQKLVTFKAENQPLNVVLSKVSAMTKVRFAFDDDIFSKISVSVNAKGISIDEFLRQLSTKYPIAYRMIGSTWVVYKDEKIAVVKTKPTIEKQELSTEPLPTKNKKEYKINRLWDLEGAVIDASTGNRLRYSKLYFDEYTQPISNYLGFFSDEIVSYGEVRATSNHWGYSTLDTVFMAEDDKDIVVEVVPLSRTGVSRENNIGEFPIHFNNYPNSFSVLNDGVARNGREATDLFNSFAFISGITTSDVGKDKKFELRGAGHSPDNILIDGIPIIDHSHFNGFISNLNSEFIHQNYIFKNGLGAEYGVNSSGVVELIGKNAFVKPSVNLTASLLATSIFVGVPISEKLSLTVAARKSITDFWPNFYYQNLTSKSLLFQCNDGIKGAVSRSFTGFYDVNGKITWQPNVRNEINIIYYRGFDDQKRDYQLTIDNDYFLKTKTGWLTNTLGLTWNFVTKNNWSSMFTASITTFNETKQNESGMNSLPGSSNFITAFEHDSTEFLQGRLKWMTEFSVKKFSHLFGAEFNYLNLLYRNNSMSFSTYGVSLPLYDSLLNKNTATQANLFYRFKYAPVKWMKLTAGLRGSYNFEMQHFYAQPRFELDINTNRNLNLYYRFGQEALSFYRTNRYNSFNEPISIFTVPVEQKNILESWQHLAGGVYDHNSVMVAVEAYYINEHGKSGYFLKDDETSYIISPGAGIRRGIDFTFSYQHHIFNHSLTYSFIDHKEKYVGINRDAYLPNIYQPKHLLQYKEMVRFSGWTGTIGVKYYSGIPYLLPQSSVNQFEYSYFDGFVNVDFSLQKQFELRKVKMEAGIVLLNLLNRQATKSINYYTMGSDDKKLLVSTTNYANRFTPTFFLSIKIN